METLAGRYVLEERLGSGGSATVWRATDTRLGVSRAVKLLDVAHGPERDALRERLRSEARAMAKVVHPHVVAVHDVGEDGDRDFIVMDLVDGPSLADRLDAEGPMAPSEAVRIAVEVLQALAAAHEEGMVHRDVKPGNVLLDATGEARLCDFGIALLEAEHRHTKTGVALGSLPYMAPEQRRDARSVGPAADLYGVGCTLYNALTCATPVDLYLAPGRSPRWATVPEALVPVIRRATSAEPGDRYVDATSMARALLRASAEAEEPEPTLDLVPNAPDAEVEDALEPSRPRGRGAVWTGVAMTAVALLVSVAAVLWMYEQIDKAQKRVAPAPAASSSCLARVEGTWSGKIGGDDAITLTIEEEADADADADAEDDEGEQDQDLELTGQAVIRSGRVLIRVGVEGRLDRSRCDLVLTPLPGEPRSGTFRAHWEAGIGLWMGEFKGIGDAEALPFFLMRVED